MKSIFRQAGNLRFKCARWSKVLFSIGWLSTVACGANSPHPRVEQMIKSHQIAMPYQLAHPDEARFRGIGVGVRSLNKIRRSSPSQVQQTKFRALAVLVKFSDKPSNTPQGMFDSLLFGTKNNSLRTYYDEVSYGNLDIVTVNFPGTVGWVTAPQPYSYYADGQNGFGEYPHNSQKLAEDVVAALDSVVDFSLYDNDGDGIVDALYIIHAGSGGEFSGSGNDIWSHTWSTFSPQLVDGVRVSVYSVEPEYWAAGGDMTCGVFAHETGHMLFQLVDLYDPGGDSHGLGKWSLMAAGSWNGSLGNSPAHPDAWSLSKMGFASPVNVLRPMFNVQIPAIEDSATIYRMWRNGSMGMEYFLVENRQRTGFDKQLPGEGLCIYHVDDVEAGNSDQWYPGSASGAHYRVALEQADNLWQLEKKLSSGDAGDPYPGSASNKSFSDSTLPGSKDYFGDYTHVSVDQIKSSRKTIRADLLVDTVENLSLAPQNVSFGGLYLGATKVESLTVFNSGGNTMNLSVSLTGDPDFSVTPASFHLAKDGRVTLYVSFSPRTTGEKSTEIVFVDNGANSIANMYLEGAGITSSYSFSPRQGWNMVSMPYTSVSNSVQSNFAYATSQAYRFAGATMYEPSDTLSAGTGYWLRTESTRVNLSGVPIDSLAIGVSTGWNMIGSISRPISVNQLVGVPDGIIGSAVFGYDQRYRTVDSMLPGRGYWVKIKEDGWLILTSELSQQPGSMPLSGNPETLSPDTLVFSDQTGLTQSLYIEREYAGNRPESAGELPPLSPAGSFDVRFVSASQGSFGLSSVRFDNSTREYPISIGSAKFPVTVTLRSKTVPGYAFRTGGTGAQSSIERISAGGALTLTDKRVSQLFLSSITREGIRPTYLLEQNYPNPFNPATTIGFELGSTAFVTIKVYNVLGQEVATPKNHEQMNQGRQEIRFDASSLSSGIYLYSITALGLIGDGAPKSFTSIKQMLLLK